MQNKLQYISQGNSKQEQEFNIRNALDNGAGWIQVRWKNASEKELTSLGEKIKRWCADYRALCIINDHISIAQILDADGVHLGLQDDTIEQAKHTLGTEKIIGGTANTAEDVIRRTKEGCDYVGLGPYRFTTTKEKLSPVLGLEGYQTIIQTLKEHTVHHPPVYAVGGILLDDIDSLMKTGIYGIALSGTITQNPTIIPYIKKLLR